MKSRIAAWKRRKMSKESTEQMGCRSPRVGSWLIETGSDSANKADLQTQQQDNYAKTLQMLKKPVKLFPIRKRRKGPFKHFYSARAKSAPPLKRRVKKQVTTNIRDILKASKRRKLVSTIDPVNNSIIPMRSQSAGDAPKKPDTQSVFAHELQKNGPRGLFLADDAEEAGEGDLSSVVGNEAYSRYNNLDGTFVWRRCLVLAYDPLSLLFTIRWAPVAETDSAMFEVQREEPKFKKVTRMNLLLEGESEEMLVQFQKVGKRRKKMLRENFKYGSLKDAPSGSQVGGENGDYATVPAGLVGNLLVRAGLPSIKEQIPYAVAPTLHEVMGEVHDMFEESMKLVRAEALWTHTHIKPKSIDGYGNPLVGGADGIDDMYEVEQSCRPRRHDLRYILNVKDRLKGLRNVNKKLRHLINLMAMMERLKRMTFLAVPDGTSAMAQYKPLAIDQPSPKRSKKKKIGFADFWSLRMDKRKKEDSDVAPPKSLDDFVADHTQHLEEAFGVLTRPVRRHHMSRTSSSIARSKSRSRSIGGTPSGTPAGTPMSRGLSSRGGGDEGGATSKGTLSSPTLGLGLAAAQRATAAASSYKDLSNVVMDFFVDDCEHLSRKYMENRSANKKPFLKVLFLANQIRWDFLRNKVITEVQAFSDLFRIPPPLPPPSPMKGERKEFFAGQTPGQTPPSETPPSETPPASTTFITEPTTSGGEGEGEGGEGEGGAVQEMTKPQTAPASLRNAVVGQEVDMMTAQIESQLRRLLRSGWAATTKEPVFKVDMVFVEEEARIGYHPPLPAFKHSVIDLVHLMVHKIGEAAVDHLIDVSIINETGTPQGPCLQLVSLEEQFIVDAKAKISEGLEHSFKRLSVLQNVYQPFNEVAWIEVEEYVAKFAESVKNQPNSLELWVEEITKQKTRLEEIRNSVPGIPVVLGLFEVDCNNVAGLLQKRLDDLFKRLLQQMQDELNAECLICQSRFAPAVAHMESPPSDYDHFSQLELRLLSSPTELRAARKYADKLWRELQVLAKFEWLVPDDVYELAIATVAWPQFLNSAEDYCRDNMEGYCTALKDRLAAETQAFDDLLSEFDYGMHEMTALGPDDTDGRTQHQHQSHALLGSLQEAEVTANEINRCRNILHLENIDYQRVQRSIEIMTGVHLLWETVVKWKASEAKWQDGSISTLFRVKDSLQEFTVNLLTVQRSLWGGDKKLEPALQLMHCIQREVHHFEKYLPLIRAMHTPGLLMRHKQQIMNELGMDLRLIGNLTLRGMVDAGALNKLDSIVDVCSLAGLEWSLNKEIKEMENIWHIVPEIPGADNYAMTPTVKYESYDDGRCLKLLIVENPITGADQLQPSERLFPVLEDQLLRCSQIKHLPFAKQFMQRVDEWHTTLLLCQTRLHKLRETQALWGVVAPLFGNRYVVQSCSKQIVKFQEADGMWTKVVQATIEDPVVLDLINQESVFRTVDDVFQKLQNVLVEIKWFFDWKRGKSMRLNLLSDQQMLALIATHDYWENITSPIINVCFPGVHSLVSQIKGEGRPAVSAVMTTAGDKIVLRRPVHSKGVGGERLEDWMNRIDLAIEISVIESNTKAFNAMQELDEKALPVSDPEYAEAFVNWASSRSQQSVELVRRVFFTKAMEDALIPMDTDGLPLAVHMPDQVINLAQLSADCGHETKFLHELGLKRTDPVANKGAWFTLSGLLGMSIHRRDVIDNMAGWMQKNVPAGYMELNNFTWACQLRAYMVGENDGFMPSVGGKADYEYKFSMCEVRRRYGNELQPRARRLVCTALTDRCYRHLLGVMHAKQAAAVIGPSGCGKTAMVRELAYTLGVGCVEVACHMTHNADYKSGIHRLIAGCAATGWFAVLDNVDCLKTEALKHIWKNLSEMMKNIAINKKVKVRLPQDGKVTVSPNFACFATVRRSTASVGGSALLPTELRRLFVPQCFVQPVQDIVGELMLRQTGWVPVANCSGPVKRLTQLFEACSRVLPAPCSALFVGLRLFSKVLKRFQALVHEGQPRVKGDITDPATIRSLLSQALMTETHHQLPRDTKSLMQRLVDSFLPSAVEGESLPTPHFESPMIESPMYSPSTDLLDFEDDDEADSSHWFDMCVDVAAKKLNLVVTEPLMQQLRTLRELLLTRKTAIVVGGSFSGKSTVLTLFCATLYLLKILEQNVGELREAAASEEEPGSFTVSPANIVDVLQRTHRQHDRMAFESDEEEDDKKKADKDVLDNIPQPRWLYLDAYSPSELFGRAHQQPAADMLNKRDFIKNSLDFRQGLLRAYMHRDDPESTLLGPDNPPEAVSWGRPKRDQNALQLTVLDGAITDKIASMLDVMLALQGDGQQQTVPWCLPDGSTLSSPQRNNVLVVETPSLATISPATLGRFPMLFMPEKKRLITPELLVESWVNKKVKAIATGVALRNHESLINTLTRGSETAPKPDNKKKSPKSIKRSSTQAKLRRRNTMDIAKSMDMSKFNDGTLADDMVRDIQNKLREWLMFLVDCGVQFLATSPYKSANARTNVHVTEMLRSFGALLQVFLPQSVQQTICKTEDDVRVTSRKVIERMPTNRDSDKPLKIEELAAVTMPPEIDLSVVTVIPQLQCLSLLAWIWSFGVSTSGAVDHRQRADTFLREKLLMFVLDKRPSRDPHEESSEEDGPLFIMASPTSKSSSPTSFRSGISTTSRPAISPTSRSAISPTSRSAISPISARSPTARSPTTPGTSPRSPTPRSSPINKERKKAFALWHCMQKWFKKLPNKSIFGWDYNPKTMKWSYAKAVPQKEVKRLLSLHQTAESESETPVQYTRKLLATGGHAYQMLCLPYPQLRALTHVATQLVHCHQPLFFVGAGGADSALGGVCKGMERLALDHVVTQLDTDRYSTQRVLMCDPSVFGANLLRSRVATSLTRRSDLQMQPPKQKQLVVYIDDLHLDTGAGRGAPQPADDDPGAEGDSIEALRELIEQNQQFVKADDISIKGTYHNRSMVRMEVEDLHLVATSTVNRFARPQEKGGMGGVDNRIRRHFNVIHIPESNWNTLASVFSHVVYLLLSADTSDNQHRFSDDVLDMASDIGNATIGVVMDTQDFVLKRARALGTACSEDAYMAPLMPLMSILQGIAFTSTTAVNTSRAMVRLWWHECTRTIEGRLRDKENITDFRKALHYNMRTHFCLHFPLHKAHRRKKEEDPTKKKFNLSKTFDKLLHHKMRRALLHWRALSWLDPPDYFHSGSAQKNEIMFTCVRSLKPPSHLIGENTKDEDGAPRPDTAASTARPGSSGSHGSAGSGSSTPTTKLRVKSLKGKLRGFAKKVSKSSKSSVTNLLNQVNDERKRMAGLHDDVEPLHDMHEELYSDMKEKLKLMIEDGAENENEYYVDIDPLMAQGPRLSANPVKGEDDPPDPPAPLGPKNEHGLPKRVMLFDHAVRDVVRLSNTIVQARASALKCNTGTGIIVTCPSQGGKSTIVSLTAKLMDEKVFTRDMTKVGSTPEAWGKFLVEMLSFPVVDTTVIPHTKRKCGVIIHLRHAETACTRALQDLLRLVRTSTCGLTQAMMHDIVELLGFRADGIPFYETMGNVQQSFRRRVTLLLSCTSLTRGGQAHMDMTNINLDSKPNSVIAESLLWQRMRDLCHVYVIRPLARRSVDVFTRGMLAQEALATYISEGSVEPYLFLDDDEMALAEKAAAAKLAQLLAEKEGKSPKPETPQEKTKKKKVSKKKSQKKKKARKHHEQKEGVVFARSQLRFLSKVEMCAAGMHHYMMSEMRWAYAPLSLLRKCLSQFWSLVVDKTPVMFERYRRIAATARKFEASEVIIQENTQFIEDITPVLTRTSSLEADLSEQMRQTIEEEIEQEALVKEAEETFVKQQSTTMKVTEQVKKELAVVAPPLTSAIKSSRKIKQVDLDEVRLIPNPPFKMKLAFAALCIMLGEQPSVTKGDPEYISLVDSYWEVAMNLFEDAEILVLTMTKYNKEDIPDDVIEKMSTDQFMNSKFFTSKEMRTVSLVCDVFVRWCRAVYKYNRALEIIRPLEQSRSDNEAKLHLAENRLSTVRNQLSRVQIRKQQISAKLVQTTAQVTELTDKLRDAQQKLDRASKLCGLFGSQYDEWVERENQLKILCDSAHGDLLLVAGSLTYLQVATTSQRQETMRAWSRLLKQQGLPNCWTEDSSKPFGVAIDIVDANKKHEWRQAGLPLTLSAVESAYSAMACLEREAIDKGGKALLILDKHGLATRWLQTLYLRKSQPEGEELTPSKLDPVNLDKLACFTTSGFVCTSLRADSRDAVLKNACRLKKPVILDVTGCHVDDLEVLWTTNYQPSSKSKTPGLLTVTLVSRYLPRGWHTTDSERIYPVRFFETLPGPDVIRKEMLWLSLRTHAPQLVTNRGAIESQVRQKQEQFDTLKESTLQLFVEVKAENFKEIHEKIVFAENSTVPLLEAITDLTSQVESITAEMSGFEPLAHRLQLLQSVMFEFLALSGRRLDVGAPAPAHAAQAMDTSTRYLQTCELFTATMLTMGSVFRALPLPEALERCKETLTKEFYLHTTVSLHLSDQPLFALLLCVRLLEDKGALQPSELMCLWKLKFDPELFHSAVPPLNVGGGGAGSTPGSTPRMDATPGSTPRAGYGGDITPRAAIGGGDVTPRTAIGGDAAGYDGSVTVTEPSPIANLSDMMWVRLKHIAKQLKPPELALKVLGSFRDSSTEWAAFLSCPLNAINTTGGYMAKKLQQTQWKLAPLPGGLANEMTTLQQIVLVGAALPSLLNQLVMRILAPTVLPRVDRIGHPARSLNHMNGSMLNRKQMEEAHAGRAENGLMQLTKDMIEEEISRNCRAPTLITVTTAEDELIVGRALARISTEGKKKLRMFDFVRGTGTTYKHTGVALRTIFNDAMKQTGRGLLTAMWVLLVGVHVLDEERMNTILKLVGDLKRNDSTRKEFRLFLTVPNECRLPSLFPCARVRHSSLGSHRQNLILNKCGKMLMMLMRSNKVIDCNTLEAVGANLLGIYDSQGRPLLGLLHPTRKKKKKTGSTPKGGGEARRYLKSPLLRTMFYYGVLHHARRQQLSEWATECTFSSDTLRYIFTRITSLSPRLKDFPWPWYTAMLRDAYCGQVVDQFWSRALELSLREWSNISANPADSLAPAEKIVALGDACAARCIAKMMDVQVGSTLCYDEIISRQQHLFNARLVRPAGYVDPGAPTTRPAADDDDADGAGADADGANGAADAGPNTGAGAGPNADADADEASAVVDDSASADAEANAEAETSADAEADSEAAINAALMQRWLDQGRLPALTQLLVRTTTKLSRCLVEPPVDPSKTPDATYLRIGPPPSFLKTALEQEKEKLANTLAVVRRSLAALMDAKKRNELHMRTGDEPADTPGASSECYFYRRVKLRDVARSLHALQVPSAWIGRDSSQGELLLWLQTFSRKLEYLCSVTDTDTPRHDLWVRALSDPHVALNAAAVDLCDHGKADPPHATPSNQSAAVQRKMEGWPVAPPMRRQSFRCSMWRHVPKKEVNDRLGGPQKEKNRLCLRGLLLFGCRWDLASERLIPAPAALSSCHFQELPPMQLKPWQLAKPKKKKKPRPPPPGKAEKSLFAVNNDQPKSLFQRPKSLTGVSDSLLSATISESGSPRDSPRARRASFTMAGSPRGSPRGTPRSRRASFSPMTTTARKRTLMSSAKPVPKDQGPWEYRCPVYAFPGGSVSASGNSHYNGGVVCSIHLLCENAETLSFCESRCVSLFCRAEE